jgi:hypothetical protein
LFINRGARLLAGKVAPVAPGGLRAYLAHFYPYRLPSLERLFPEPITFRNPATGHPRTMRLEEMGYTAVKTALEVLQKIEAGEHRLAALLPGGWNLHTGLADQPMSSMRFFETDRPLDKIIGVDPGR